MTAAVLLFDAESFPDVPEIGDGKGGDRIFAVVLFVHILIVYSQSLHKKKGLVALTGKFTLLVGMSP
jgi:hypothetical protein